MAWREEEGIEELLYTLEKGPAETMGDVEGEKEKFCWKGPADVIIGSFSRWKVSSGKGIPA